MELQQSIVNFQNLALVFIFCLWLYWLWSRRQYYAFALRFPGKLGLPIFGSLLSAGHIDNSLRLIGSLIKGDQQTVCFWSGLSPVLLTKETAVVEKILNSAECLEKAMPLYEPLDHALKGGMLAAEAKKWRFLRRNLCVIFNEKSLLSFFPIFNDVQNKMIKDFECFADGKEHFVLNAILNNITSVASETLSHKKLTDERIPNLIEKFLYVMRAVSIQMICTSFKLEKLLRSLPNFRKQVRSLHEFVENWVVEAFHEKENINQNAEIEVQQDQSDEKSVVLADLLYKLYKEQKFSWDDVVSAAFTLVLGSLETTSNTIYSALVFLATHASVQQRLYEEITTVFHEKDTYIRYEHFKQLPYLERVLQETMRLAPAFPIIGRQFKKPFQLPNGAIVPGNMSVYISIYHIQRCENLWGANANKFDPDNFLPENIAKRDSYAYIPFSKGPRNCIGLRYAQLVLKVMLIGLIRNFRFETDFNYEDLEIKFNVSSAFIKNPGLKVYRRL